MDLPAADAAIAAPSCSTGAGSRSHPPRRRPRGPRDRDPPALPMQPPSIRRAGRRPTTRPSPLGGTARARSRRHSSPTDLRFPINLATALRLSDARPLIVAAAQASVWVAEADLTQAKVLWIPTLNFAADYLRHDGGGPDFNKGVMTAPSVNFFYAGGGLYGIIVHLTDAIYQPLVARQILNARHFDVQTAKNDALLRTADAYFRRAPVPRHVRRHALLRRAGPQAGRADRHPEPRPGPGVRGRAGAEHARRPRAAAVPARQQWRVQSANLTQVLRLDPRAVVEPMEHDHLQITLIDPARTLEELMPIALTNRPELASRQAMVEAAGAAIRREKMRPFLPVVWLTGYQTPGGMLIQAGIFGLGPNSSLNQWTGREDVSVQLMWQLESFGFGNLARIKRQRGQQSQAIIDLRRAQDAVAADVNRALARVQSATSRVIQADRVAAHGHHHLQRSVRGPGADQAVRRRPGPGQPAAGGGLCPAAPARGLRRVLHHGGRVQPGAVRPVPRAGLPRAGGHLPPAARQHPAGGHGPAATSCPRSATGRPRRHDDRRRPGRGS